MKHRNNRNNRNAGFSLIEVLVTVFVFGTGILGLASLQMNSLSTLTNSHSASIAVIAANDMADRMRANPVAVFGGSYDAIDGSEDDPECAGDCSNSEIAQYDAFAVKTSLNGQLPAPELSVTNVGNNLFTIEVKWLERSGSHSETKSYRTSFVPYKP